jgi:ribosomal protein L7/L12
MPHVVVSSWKVARKEMLERMDNLLFVLGACLVVVVPGIVVFVLARRWGNMRARTGFMPESSHAEELLAPDEEIRDLLARGKKIQAIKRVRELTGMGLKEAKDYVDALPHAPPLGRLLLVRSAQPIGHEVEQEARRLLDDGGKIAAIKRVRELTGMGLKEAKDYFYSL